MIKTAKFTPTSGSSTSSYIVLKSSPLEAAQMPVRMPFAKVIEPLVFVAGLGKKLSRNALWCAGSRTKCATFRHASGTDIDNAEFVGRPTCSPTMMPPISRIRPRSLRRRRLITRWGSSSFIGFRLQESTISSIGFASASPSCCCGTSAGGGPTSIGRVSNGSVNTDPTPRPIAYAEYGKLDAGRARMSIAKRAVFARNDGNVRVIGDKWRSIRRRSISPCIVDGWGVLITKPVSSPGASTAAKVQGPGGNGRSGRRCRRRTLQPKSPAFSLAFATAEMMFSALGLAVASIIKSHSPSSRMIVSAEEEAVCAPRWVCQIFVSTAGLKISSAAGKSSRFVAAWRLANPTRCGRIVGQQQVIINKEPFAYRRG